MKKIRKITDKMLCFGSDFKCLLNGNGLNDGLISKLTSELYYRPNGFNSLYIVSCDVRESVRREVFFKLRK